MLLTAAVLDSVSTGTRWALVAAAAVLVVAGVVGFQLLGRRMTVHGGPGYDAFQRAGSADAVRTARQAWGPDGLAAARKALLLDLVFPVCYAVALALLASLCATHADSLGWGGFASAMALVSWLGLAAGAVDLVENAGVFVGLWRTPSDRAARLARVAGWFKRLLLAFVASALILAGFAFLFE